MTFTISPVEGLYTASSSKTHTQTQTQTHTHTQTDADTQTQTPDADKAMSVSQNFGERTLDKRLDKLFEGRTKQYEPYAEDFEPLLRKYASLAEWDVQKFSDLTSSELNDLLKAAGVKDLKFLQMSACVDKAMQASWL